MTSRGLAPGPSDERPTTVDVPPEHWFFGTGVDLTCVAQLRLAHTHTNQIAIPGAAEPTTQSYGTGGVLRTSGQNMVTEMGYVWLADISPYVARAYENILPEGR